MSDSTNEAMPRSAETPQQSSFPAGFDYMVFTLSATLDKFDANALRAYYRDTFPPEPEEVDYSPDHYAGAVAPRNPETNYHVHLAWDVAESSVDLSVEYHAGRMARGEDEREPFAEEVMPWLGRFFTYENAHALCMLAFTYPLETRQSKFPLPLKIDLGVEAEIDGMSLRLTSKPEGVSALRFSQGPISWYVSVLADRRVVFESFTPYATAHAVASVIDNVLIEVGA